MYCYGWAESQYTPEARHSSCQGHGLYAARTLCVFYRIITISRHTITHFVSIIDHSGMRCFVVNTI